MLRDGRTERRAWWRSLVAGLCLAWGLALPAQSQDEPVVEETSPVEVFVQPDPNDTVVILSNGVPPTRLRVREPKVRVHVNLHAIGERSDQADIPTLGMSSQVVDTVYHGTSDYGEPTGIRNRSPVGAREFQPILTHRIAGSPNGSRIRYHGGFR